MKNYVITIQDEPRSVECAARCIKSAAKHGRSVKMFDAITPRNTNLYSMLSDEGISKVGFEERYSRIDNCIAAFLSHYSLWKKCVETKTNVTIFEHDAVVLDQINTTIPFDKCVTLGRPSYGRFNVPTFFGTGPLTQKRYFGGAHAYSVSPQGAQELINQAKIEAKPTDVFLHVDTFPWLQEHYPWRVEARDVFSTIQKTEGCLAKHSYGEDYAII